MTAFKEVNKAYYSAVLDSVWAKEMARFEAEFWEQVGLILEHGHRLKSSFWQANPL